MYKYLCQRKTNKLKPEWNKRITLYSGWLFNVPVNQNTTYHYYSDATSHVIKKHINNITDVDTNIMDKPQRKEQEMK